MFARLDENKNVVPCDLDEYAAQFKDDAARRVDMTQVQGDTVSTVFLALDHGIGMRSLWFETMVFDRDGNPLGLLTKRYATWDEAVAGHAEVVELVHRRHALPAPPDGILGPPDGGIPS